MDYAHGPMTSVERRTAVTRRWILQRAAGLLAGSAWGSSVRTADNRVAINSAVSYGQHTLPADIRSRRIDNNNGATLHILEAGFQSPKRACVVLLHGFPELAYTWRKQLLPLAHAGFHVVAPDLRGYGRSAPVPVAFQDDLTPYSMLNRVGDVLGLIRAIGYDKAAAVIGHDWGGPTAQWCARLRPDVFRSVVSLSTPFLGTASLPLETASKPMKAEPAVDIDEELAALPRPRKHYATYSASEAANPDMWHAPQGVHDLLRAMYHFKSADWKGNEPHPLRSWSAPELAQMPEYYIMGLNKGIAETMAAAMPSRAQIKVCGWMTEEDLQVYSTEFLRTGFQGGLNYYRAGAGADFTAFAGQTIDVPACYIGGDCEWAVYQTPGAFEGMAKVCTRLRGVHLLPRAGHSLAEEQPDAVNRLLIDFLRETITA
jgi:pimeloyl-ACP methyl ester carboxylesterase